jgi:hypothetical protein
MAKATIKSTSRRAARTPAVVDPIFDAIEAHRAAFKRCRVKRADDDEETYDALVGVAVDRLAELLAMTPTTPAGSVAMLRYVGAYAARDDSGLFNNWYDPVSKPGASLLGRLAAVIEPAA